MSTNLLGIHHITAIAGDPQRNLDFYADLLGLNLVKLTVNFDDPGTYHLYFGDERGRPGTILTFFPWPGGVNGSKGTGQATELAFSIPVDSMGFWSDRLRAHNVAVGEPFRRFDEQVLAFSDPDGLNLELIGIAGSADTLGLHGAVPPEYAVTGLHSVTLSESGAEATHYALTEILGFRAVGREGSRERYEVGPGGAGTIVDVIDDPSTLPGRIAVGTVHHVAWRAPNQAAQEEWRDRILGHGVGVTPVTDRKYFQSIYFREPGNVLFEIATDPPGFSVDEDERRLGTHLMLPPWLESDRSRLEKMLPRLKLPEYGRAA